MSDYNLQSIFEAMEDELIASYRRNMARHTAEELKEGFEWPMWQALKFRDLKSFESDVASLLKKYGKQSDAVTQQAIQNNFFGGASNADRLLKELNADVSDISDDSFFKANESQIGALQTAVSNDLQKAEHAVLRMSNDVFRSTIFKAQMFYQSGVSTLWKAVDLASKDFFDRGLNCIQYKNGARVNIASYAEMALRASAKKAYMVGEGKRSAEYGVTLCQVTQYSACSPICLQWQGRIYIDDVYAGGKPDGKHRLLSTAINGGLFHPHCRHIKQPYYDGISEPLQPINKSEISENYEAEQRQREIERNIRKFKRRATGSLDPKDQVQAQIKVSQWQNELKKHLKENPQLRENVAREQTEGFGKSAAQKSVWSNNRVYSQALHEKGLEISPKDVAKHKQLKYTNPPEYKLQQKYLTSVNKGMLSPLSGYDNYKVLYNRVESEIVGLTTSNGIKINSQSNHFMERVIGTMRDPTHENRPRSGVSIEDIIDALKSGKPHPIKKTTNRKTGKLEPSQTFSSIKCDISINPDTGTLIQCNPA